MEEAKSEECGRSRSKSEDEQKPIIPPASLIAQSTQEQDDFVPNMKRITRKDLLVTRPPDLKTKIGAMKDCNKVNLIGNYFSLTSNSSWAIHLYSVTFEPGEKLFKIRKEMLSSYKGTLGAFMYDGINLLSPKIITPSKEEVKELYYSKGTGEVKTCITIKYLQELDYTDHRVLNLFDSLVRSIFSMLNFNQVGRDYFDPKAMVNIRAHGLQIWPGYTTNIRTHQNSILMGVEIAHRIIRKETAYDVWRDSRRSDDQEKFKHIMVNTMVITQYNNATYRVDDVDFENDPTQTFLLKGELVSYVDFYYRKYNIRIRDLSQPMLVCKTRPYTCFGGKTVVLVPELCTLTGLTERMRSDFDLMNAINRETRLYPQQRLEKLMAFHGKLSNNQQIKEEMDSWSLSLSNDLVKMQGRTFPAEPIAGSGNKVISRPDRTNWNDMFRQGSTLYRAVHLKRWLVVTPTQMKTEAYNCIQYIKRTSERMGITWDRPDTEYMNDDRPSNYSYTLEKMLSRRNYSFVLCFVVNTRQDRYAAIKRKLCIDRSVPCQVITLRACNPRGLLSVATKLSIQINCKLGGAPWVLKMPIKGIMVIGYDVTAHSNNKRIRYGAMVSTTDQQMTKYYSTVYEHYSNEERSNHISQQLIKALLQYNQQNKCLPNRVLFYRDGVTDDQIPFVYTTELNDVLNAIKEVYKNSDDCRLTYTIVNRHITTRLFEHKYGEIINPIPGTVADTEITKPERYDFFLVSQYVREGTVSPTSYNVIYDKSGLTPEQIQLLTYKLTHGYYNWSGTVKVPAPVQYARKLALLCGEHVHRPVGSGLENLLYYL